MTSRFTDWTHVRVVGDREAAAPYVGEARKLLGAVFEEAKRNGLGVHVQRRELPDGTVIVAEKFGDVPRITIAPAAADIAQQPTAPPEAFVVWARDQAHPGGIDPEHPQQLLRPSWTTFFYSESTQGYEAFAGKKGTYAGALPAGVRHAGNIDWRGASGQRVSWYGPSTRYWLDPHVHPTRQYGTQVFLLGQVLLDTDDADPGDFAERWVVGAAMPSPFELLVVQAALVPGATDDTPPPPNSSEISTPWPPGDVAIAVCRFAVVEESPQRFRAQLGSRDVLWAGTLPRALNPWFFNESGDRAVTAGLPETVLLRRGTGAVIADPDTIEGVPPSASNSMHTFVRTSDSAGSLTSAAVSLTAGQAVIAADFAGNALRQMTVRRRVADDLDAQFVFEHGEWSFEARSAVFELQSIAGLARATYRGHLGALIHADLREQVFVTYRADWVEVPNLPSANTYREAVQIWHGGTLHADLEVATGTGAGQNPINTGFTRQLGATRLGDRPIPRYDTVYSDVALSPMFAIYGHITQHQREPRWDWTGAHGLYSFRPFSTDHWFGAAKVRNALVTQVARIDASTDAGFESSGTDFDGKTIAVSCATADGITVLSGYGYVPDRSVFFATGGELSALTGVDGEFARYHPIWPLGQPPRIE